VKRYATAVIIIIVGLIISQIAYYRSQTGTLNQLIVVVL